MNRHQPTEEQRREATDGVAERGWTKSKAAHHGWYPTAIREDDGTYRPCEHCGATRNPARWPLFFSVGPHAGQLLWTCSTCKISQSEVRDTAQVLVNTPRSDA